MATYTPDQWIAKMNERIDAMSDEKVMKTAIYDVIAQYSPRIFVKGLNSRNMVIGVYSTKSTYINTKVNSPKTLSPIGKKGKAVFKNGKRHKTRYFQLGYKEFKGAIGRGVKVNLRLFNTLQNDVNSQTLRKTQLGFDLILKRQEDMDKVVNLTSHFGGTKIFALTKQENAHFRNIYRKEILAILQK